MKKGERFWCWWMSRYIYYKGYNNRRGVYEFLDICDEPVDITKKDLKNLRKKP